MGDATGSNRNVRFRFAAASSQSLDFFDNIHAFNDFAKHDMLLIEPRCDDGCDEEL